MGMGVAAETAAMDVCEAPSGAMAKMVAGILVPVMIAVCVIIYPAGPPIASDIWTIIAIVIGIRGVGRGDSVGSGGWPVDTAAKKNRPDDRRDQADAHCFIPFSAMAMRDKHTQVLVRCMPQCGGDETAII